MGKKTSLYSGGNNPTVTPQNSPAEGGTTAGATVLQLGPAVLQLPLAVLPCNLGGLEHEQESDPVRYYRGGRGGTAAVIGAVLPLLERYYHLYNRN